MKYSFLMGLLLVILTTKAQTAQDSTKLPTPTGPYSVGVSTFYWSDPLRPEEVTPRQDDFRQFAASVFYPGIRDQRPPRAYFPNLDLFRAAFDATDTPGARGVDTFSRHFANVITDVYENIPIDRSGGPYPAIFISPGGDMSRHWYTAMAQELSSHGYIVVAVSHAHSGIDIFPLGGLVGKNSFYQERVPPSNALLTQRIREDVVYITDRILALNGQDSNHFLKNSIDTSRMVIAGHSRGGRAVNHVLRSDKRFAGGIRLDGLGPPLDSSFVLSKPHLTIRIPWKWEERLAQLHQLHAVTRATSYEVVIENASHFSFCDLPLIVPERFAAEIEEVSGHLLITQVMLGFLSKILHKDAPRPSVLNGERSKPENIQVHIYEPDK